MIIRPFNRADEAAVIALWNECGLTRPWNDPAKDIAFAMSGSASSILLAEDDGKLIGCVMVGHDGHRGAIYYLAVAPNYQRQGLGRKLHDAAVAWLQKRGVWKINLMVRFDNVQASGFYQRLGYAQNDVVSFGKLIKGGEGK